jgi:hypothetical protein
MRIFGMASAAALLLTGGCNVTVNNQSMDNEADALGNKAESAADSAGNAVDRAASTIENKADRIGNMHVDVNVRGHDNEAADNKD